MNKEDLLEEIKYCGKVDIANIFDDLVDDSLKINNDKEIELTEDILVDLKKILILLIDANTDFAKKIQVSLDKEENVPADMGVMSGITVITVAAICALLTMHANELRALHPNLEFRDCSDIIKSLKLDRLLDFFTDE